MPCDDDLFPKKPGLYFVKEDSIGTTPSKPLKMLDMTATVTGTITAHFTDPGLIDFVRGKIASPTHDYICPDCLAIVHDESGVPECTGWPKAMQHARRFMEPFGGEI